MFGNDPEKREKHFTRRAIGLMRLHLAYDHAEGPVALARKVEDRIDGKGQHRALDVTAGVAREHRFGFGMRAKQPVIDQRRYVRATLGSQFKAAPDRMAHLSASRSRDVTRDHVGAGRCCGRLPKKEEQGSVPCSRNCVDPVFPI
ncbi:hypothetical protein [Bradyrhizobium sp.]|uniref:hypothetical protein n=1 Tax=Bradyrhizobium sp. TaxID=376 RepID=UPI001EC9916A|nr:hypothetical protein [Bradyrhizobium sp.]